ncbi:MAG TPA: hypothetical protein VGQ46_12405 [Thermoanaerobaculia bacterium]|jgi:hypothetical protein|nr:hypothetical protein [Thermoanaerobaculia bacterium]
MRGRFVTSILLSVAVFFTLAAATRRHAVVPPGAAPQEPITSLDMRRSMIVTDVALLQGFTFDRFLNQLIARSGVHNLSSAQLFRQWFDTENPKPGLADPLGPHCDDFRDSSGYTFNGFPRACPTPEGELAATPYTAGEYIPIALVNRFDQTPADGSNCGQYRIIYAKPMATGLRLHIILEPVLPNPNPSAGLAGCRAIAQFWANLTKVDSIAERRAKLEQFYFDGIPGVAPVIDPDHFSVTGGGIRTTQIAEFNAAPRMYQFHVTKNCSSGECTLRMTPDILNNMVFGALFNSSDTSAQAAAFRDIFVAQVPNLAVRDANEYFMEIPRDYVIAESDPPGEARAFEYVKPFNKTKASAPEFKNRIQAKLTSIGSTLTPEMIVHRAETQNCVGCHFFGDSVGEGVTFPHSIDGIQHVTEDTLESGDGGQRYLISSGLRDTYIPHRMKILIDFLNSGKAPVRSQ